MQYLSYNVEVSLLDLFQSSSCIKKVETRTNYILLQGFFKAKLFN